MYEHPLSHENTYIYNYKFDRIKFRKYARYACHGLAYIVYVLSFVSAVRFESRLGVGGVRLNV